MAVPAAREIAPGVYLLRVGRGAIAANVYLVSSSPGWVLIDAAWAGSAPAIGRAAESLFGPGPGPAAIRLGGDPAHPHPSRPLRLGPRRGSDGRRRWSRWRPRTGRR